MIKSIKSLSPLAILLLASQIQAMQAPSPVKVFGRNGWTKAQSQGAPLQQFTLSGQIRENEPFDNAKGFANHPPLIFAQDEAKSEVLLGWMAGASVGTSPLASGQVDMKRFLEMSKTIKSADLGAMSTGAAKVFGELAHLLTERKNYSHMTPASFEALLGALPVEHQIQFVQSLEEKALVHFASGINAALGLRIHRLNDKVLKTLLADHYVCGVLTYGQLDLLSKDQLAGISPECAARIDGRKITARTMPKLKSNFFSLTQQEYTPGALARMTVDQARTFNDGLKDGTECTTFNVFKLNSEAFKAVPLTCVKNALGYSLSQSDATDLKKHIKNIPKEFFLAASSTEVKFALELLEYKRALEALTTEQVNAIMMNHENCEHVQVKLLERHRSASISALCFGNMDASQQSAVLSHFDQLPDDIFSLLDKAKVEAWKVSRGKHTDLTHWAVLNAMTHLENLAEIIHHIDSAYGEHPASLIESLSQLTDVPPLLHHLTGDFLDATGITITDEEFKENKLPERLRYLLPIGQLGHLDWTKVDRDQVGHLISGHSFCKQATQGIWEQIDKKHLDQMTPRCAAAMRQKDRLSPALCKALPQSAFRLYTARSVTVDKFDVKVITDAQLSQLSADVTAPGQHVATTFTEATLTAMNAERLGHLSGSTLAACPAAAFKSFNSKERVQALNELAMAKLDLERVQAIPNLHDVTPFQLVHLDQSVLSAFTPEIRKKMSPEAIKVLDQRLGVNAAGRSLGVGAAGLAAVAVIAAMFV